MCIYDRRAEASCQKSEQHEVSTGCDSFVLLYLSVSTLYKSLSVSLSFSACLSEDLPLVSDGVHIEEA